MNREVPVAMVIAMIGTYASMTMGVPEFDGVASIGIGLAICHRRADMRRLSRAAY